jgi:hypothetical protein
MNRSLMNIVIRQREGRQVHASPEKMRSSIAPMEVNDPGRAPVLSSEYIEFVALQHFTGKVLHLYFENALEMYARAYRQKKRSRSSSSRVNPDRRDQCRIAPFMWPPCVVAASNAFFCAGVSTE